MCSNASTFGVQVCIERKSVHAGFIKNVPLYYLVGEHALRMSFKPGKHNHAQKKRVMGGWVGVCVYTHSYLYMCIYIFRILSTIKTTIRPTRPASIAAGIPFSPTCLSSDFPAPSNATQHGQHQAELICACRACLMHPESLDLGCKHRAIGHGQQIWCSVL